MENNELFSLIGEFIGSKKIEKYMKKFDKHYKLDEEKKEYSDCIYFSYKNIGISFQFMKKNNENKPILENIHLFKKGEFGYKKTFQGQLPYDIKFSMFNSEIVKKFGEEPDKKGNSGNSSIPIWIEYTNKGIHFQFKSIDWDDRKNEICSIIIFNPK